MSQHDRSDHRPWEITQDDLLDLPDDPRFDHTTPTFLTAVARSATQPGTPTHGTTPTDRSTPTHGTTPTQRSASTSSPAAAPPAHSESAPSPSSSSSAATTPTSPTEHPTSPTSTQPGTPTPGTPPTTTPPALSHRDILAGAHLGFSAEHARAVLADHASLVFLGRLWDSARTNGQPIGSVRVPPRIWDLADSPTPEGHLTAQLLEATGLRVPTDFGQALDFHLLLWQAEAPALVRGAATPAAAEPAPRATCDGPVSVEARPASGGIEVELRSPFPGPHTVELHWPDGSRTEHTTPPLTPGQPHTFLVPRTGPALPSSIRVTRTPTP